MIAGTVSSMDLDWLGDSLTWATDPDDTLLHVDTTVDFDEKGGWLVVGDSDPVAYTAVDEDAGTVTVATAPGPFEAGTPVYLYDPTTQAKEKRALRYVANVQLHDGRGPITVSLPYVTTSIMGIDSLVGASVRLDPTDEGEDQWEVSTVLGRDADVTITGAVIQTSADGARAVLREGEGDGGGILFVYTGSDYELTPGYVYAYQVPLGGTDVVLEMDVRAPALEDGTNSPYLALTTTRGSGSVETAAGLHANKVNLNGIVVSSSLANGGSSHQNSGTKYVRAGDEGRLFSSTTAPSSRTIKHDIADLDLDADAVLALRPVTYRYNEAPDTLRVGFIAEEAHDLGLAGLVGYEDRDDPERPTGFDYDGFGAALLAVVQRQQAQIEDLSARLAALEG